MDYTITVLSDIAWVWIEKDSACSHEASHFKALESALKFEL